MARSWQSWPRSSRPAWKPWRRTPRKSKAPCRIRRARHLVRRAGGGCLQSGRNTMQQETYQGSDPLRQFFQWNETMWADMQRASLGDNPVTRALSEVNAQDLNTFYN